MKKILSVILTAAILFLTACNNSPAENKSQSANRSPADGSFSEKGSEPQASSEAPKNEPTTESQAEQNSSEAQSSPVSEPAVDLPSSSSQSSQKSEISAPNSAGKPEIKPETKPESGASVPESKPENPVSAPAEDPKPPQSSSSVTESSKTPEPQKIKEENNLNITIKINGKNYSATLYGSEAAKAFKNLLPLKLDMSELNGNEKYYYLSGSLPTNASRPSGIKTGDIMLYGSNCLVLFYEDFPTSYSYTPLGKVDDPAGLAAALGSGDVRVEFN